MLGQRPIVLREIRTKKHNASSTPAEAEPSKEKRDSTDFGRLRYAMHGSWPVLVPSPVRCRV